MWDNPVLTVWVPATDEVLRVAADEVGLGKTGIGSKAPAGIKTDPTV